MTPEQRKALVDACETGDDVRIVTIALQVAAMLARERKVDAAMAIRGRVDQMKAEKHMHEERRRKRLEIAASLYWRAGSISDSVKLADALIEENENEPLIGDAP
jgi:hypothetical protein